MRFSDAATLMVLDQLCVSTSAPPIPPLTSSSDNDVSFPQLCNPVYHRVLIQMRGARGGQIQARRNEDKHMKTYLCHHELDLPPVLHLLGQHDDRQQRHTHSRNHHLERAWPVVRQVAGTGHRKMSRNVRLPLFTSLPKGEGGSIRVLTNSGRWPS